MLGYGVVLFAAVFQVISAQGPPQPPNFPQQCRGPPPGVERPQECCKIPPFFTDEDFAECGFQKLDAPKGDGPQHKRGPPDCSKQLCMLKKYNLLKDETTIDHEALTVFMDQWAEANQAFKPAVDSAKERCVGKDLPGPPHICEANKLVFCISSTLFSECPVWEQTGGCQTLKEHLDLCKPFFPH